MAPGRQSVSEHVGSYQESVRVLSVNSAAPVVSGLVSFIRRGICLPTRRISGWTWGKLPRAALGHDQLEQRLLFGERPAFLFAGDTDHLVVELDGQRMAALQLVLAKADGHERTVAVVVGQVDEQRVGSAGLAGGRQGKQAKQRASDGEGGVFHGVLLEGNGLLSTMFVWYATLPRGEARIRSFDERVQWRTRRKLAVLEAIIPLFLHIMYLEYTGFKR